MSLNIENKVKVTYTLDKDSVNKIKLLASNTLKRTNNDVLRSIRLESINGTLYGESTNLESWYRTEITSSATSQDDLNILVPADAFKSLKTPKKNEKLTLSIVEEEPTNILILGSTTIKGYPGTFPNFPEYESQWSIEKLHESYFNDLSLCALSSARSMVRPTLMGICHRRNHLMSTDRMRLAKINTDMEFEQDVILPASAAKFLLKTFDKTDTSMDVGSKYVMYTNDDSTVFVRRIDGSYPDVERIININEKYTGTIKNTEQWLDVLKEIKTVTKHTKSGYTTLSFDDECIISAKNDTQEITSKLDFEGTGVDIAFNTEYLYDALSQAGDNPTLLMNESDTPFKIISQDGRIEALVSPIRIR